MVRIRLRRVGAKKQPSYRVVVADSRAPRDGRFIETIGHYNPRTDPPTVVIFEDRAIYWLSQGAQPSKPVLRFFSQLGLADKVKQVHGGASVEDVAAPRPEPVPGRPTKRRTPRKRAAPTPPAGKDKAAVEAGADVVEAPEAVEAPVAEAEAEAKVEPEAPEAVEAPVAQAEAEAKVEPAAPEAVEVPVAEAEAEAEVETEPEPQPEPEPVAAPGMGAAAPEAVALADLGLSTRVLHVLEGAGITSASELAAKLAEGEEQLLAVSGIGAKAVEEIRTALGQHGLNPEA